MAAIDDAFTTGKDDGDVRRRNVPTYQKANGATVNKMEAEDAKKLQTVSSVERGVAYETSPVAKCCIA